MRSDSRGTRHAAPRWACDCLPAQHLNPRIQHAFPALVHFWHRRCLQLSLCCEAFAADSSVGDGFFTKKTRLAEPLLAEFDVSSCRQCCGCYRCSQSPLAVFSPNASQLHEDFQFTYSAWGFGNETALIK